MEKKSCLKVYIKEQVLAKWECVRYSSYWAEKCHSFGRVILLEFGDVRCESKHAKMFKVSLDFISLV